jgi:phage terminase large subunit
MTNSKPSPGASSPSANLRRARAELERRRRARLRWFNDPVAYAREALGVEPWSRQIEILEAVAQHPRVAVRSGHKVGKSNSLSVIAHWWCDTRPDGWVVMSSSSGRQVKSILWEEFCKLYDRAKHRLGPEPATDPGTGYRSTSGSRVQGFSTNKPERMAGFSGANLLFLLDEASGIPESIFEAIEGNRAGGARVVMYSNPTQTSGTFYNAFHSKREFWKTIHISSEDSPNIRENRVVVPGLAMPDWLAEKLKEWGEDSPIFQVRVRGNFPSQGSNAVIGLALVTAAQERWLEDEETIASGEERLFDDSAPLALGVDPARFGDDDSVIVPGRGKKVQELRAFTGLDGVQLAGRVVETIRERRRLGDPLPHVKVDSIGIGASCCDQLRYHKGPDGRPELVLVEVNSAEAATDETCHRLRDQLWFGVRDWLKEGGALPNDDKLARDLVAPIYGFDPQARYLVEPKRDTKKRLGNSPDRADALALYVYSPTPTDALLVRVRSRR